MIPMELNERRIAFLIATCRNLIPVARRARLTGTLAQLRHIAVQLDALDPTAPEAADVLDAAGNELDRAMDEIEAAT